VALRQFSADPRLFCAKLREGGINPHAFDATKAQDIGLNFLRHPTKDHPMQFFPSICACAAALLLSTAAIGAVRDISGVKVEDSAVVGGVTLRLNGAGVRAKTMIDVYVATLYTGQKVTSLEELVNIPGPKRLSMTFLRDIDSATFGKLLTRGIEDNVPASQRTKLTVGLLRMGEIFASNKSFTRGDVVALDWIPNAGMVITGKGKQLGAPFAEPEFYRGMMSIWFGPQPADTKLKEAMLGAAK